MIFSPRHRRVPLMLIAAVTLVIPAAPAAADEPWFAPRIDSAIDNGAGPGPAPRGSASADFNSDARPDLVTIGNFTYDDVRVVPNVGNGRFGSAIRITGTTDTQGLDAGDVNGDGKADVVAMTTKEVRIKLGNGSNGFSDGGSYPLTLGGQVEPIIVDVDRDGDNDIVAPTFTAIQTLLNSGGGTFSPGPTSQVSGAGALSAIAVAALDPDGNQDLFAVDGFSGTTFALRGSRDGRFTVSGQLYSSGFVPEDVAAIDLDGDGFDDAATVGSFSFTLATGLTDGTGKFRKPVGASTTYGGPGPTSAAVADFDGDGRDDLVVSALADPSQGTLTVLAGNGTEKMRKVGAFASAPFPQNPVLEDYDGDVDVDIAVVSPGAISVLPNVTP